MSLLCLALVLLLIGPAIGLVGVLIEVYKIRRMNNDRLMREELRKDLYDE